MPYLDSNIASKIYHASIGSEVLCLARTAMDLNIIVTNPNLLLRMKKHCGEFTRIISLLKKIFGRTFKVFDKFADTTNTA